MPEGQLRQLAREPYEYSESPRADEPEWDGLINFAKRRVCYILLLLFKIISIFRTKIRISGEFRRTRSEILSKFCHNCLSNS